MQLHRQAGWLLLIASTSFGTKVREQRVKSTKKSKKSKKSNTATAGLQQDCYVNDDKRFNVCLELNSLDMKNAYATGVCKENCTRSPTSASCSPQNNVAISRGFVDQGWMPAAVEAKNRIEDLITKDTVSPFSPLNVTGSLSSSTINSTAFLVDDVHIRIIEGLPTFRTNVIMLAVASSRLRLGNDGKSLFPQICRIDLFGGFCGVDPFYKQYVGTDGFSDLFFHEMLHCLGLSTSNSQVNIYRVNAIPPNTLRTWNGPIATKAWRDLGCTGDIPLDTSGFHLLESCFQNELMTPDVGIPGSELLLSTITGGMLEDLGYKVDDDVLDKFTLQDLDACGCANYCPKAAKSCTRRLNDPHPPSQKGEPKNGYKRNLNPITTVPIPIPTEQPPSEDSDWDAFMKYLYGFYRNESNDTTFHLVLAREDGSIYDLDASYSDVVAYARLNGWDLVI